MEEKQEDVLNPKTGTVLRTSPPSIDIISGDIMEDKSGKEYQFLNERRPIEIGDKFEFKIVKEKAVLGRRFRCIPEKE
jgi:hypothetical protein